MFFKGEGVNDSPPIALQPILQKALVREQKNSWFKTQLLLCYQANLVHQLHDLQLLF